MRMRLTLEYDGTAYAGWQWQENAVSVQQRVTEAIFSLTGERVSVVGASRTDAGVHARGQTAHFDTDSAIPPEKWCYAINTRLPADIRVTASQEAEPGFHARYGARGKRYAYTITTGPHAPAIGRQYVWHVPMDLDAEAMHRAAAAVIGAHDFKACMASGSAAKSTVRAMRGAEVRREGSLVVFSICGEGFLYNMVRILAGTLCYVGQGRLGEDCIERALLAGDRLLLGPTAPALGLCLEEVWY